MTAAAEVRPPPTYRFPRRAVTLGAALALAATTAVVAAPTSAADPAKTLTLTVRGETYDGVRPILEVRVNGQDVGKVVLESDKMTDYNLNLPNALAKGDRVDVRFTNDKVGDGPDRNVWLDEVKSAGVTQGYSAASYDRGDNWQDATDGKGLETPTEVMPWNGALRFTWPGERSGGQNNNRSGLAQPFADYSFWYQKIPAQAPLHSQSRDYANVLEDDVRNHYGKATLNTNGYSPPIYVVDGSTPRKKVTNSLCGGPNPDMAWLDREWGRQFNSVPVPDNATGALGTDSEVVVWSPSTNEVWEMWKFERRGGEPYACWGGKFSDAKAKQGIFDDVFGVTGSGLSLLGGTVRVEELRAGRIDHAVAIGINRPKRGEWTWPATRTDGTWDAGNAIEEGQRFRLNPNLNVDSLPIGPAAKVIAKAAQEYGMIVRDRTAGPLVVYAENSTPYTSRGEPDPYVELYGSNQYDLLKGFPWGEMQALPKNYGKP